MWTMNELFYGGQPQASQWVHPKPPETPKEVKKEESKKEDVQLKVDLCCEGCERKIRKVLINLPGVNTLTVHRELQKVTLAGGVKADDALKAIHNINKRASLWGEDKNPKKK